MENLKFELSINSRQFFESIQTMPMGYMLLNSEGNIMAINQILLHASQYTEQDLLHKSYEVLINFDGTKEDFIDKLSSFTVGNNYKLCWKDLNGDLSYSKVFVWKTNIKPVIYAIAFLDVYKEKQLSLLARFAENFVTDINIGIIVIDKELRISEISPLACNLLNVSKNEVLNRTIDEIFLGIPEEHRIVQSTLLEGITVSNYAITWTYNQERSDLLVDSNIIKDDKGAIVGAYVIFKDVTNLRSLEQQVRHNDRLSMIGQIAAGTAHEIRNPLTSIKGFLQILKSTLSENNLLNELDYTEIMLTEVDRINKLLNEILLLSKPKDIIYKPTDINAVLKAILPIISNESLLLGIEVKYDFDQSLALVIADSELLKQVLLNISKNGIEAMSDGGILTISAKVINDKKNINISIHDTGPGIPNYIVDRIFDPFFTTKDNGTGLGLSICQKIIHDLGGSIRVSTKGFGTTFQIFLPFI